MSSSPRARSARQITTRSALNQIARYGGRLKDEMDRRLVVPLAAHSAARPSDGSGRPHAVVVPSQRPGSLGDQAMVVSLVSQLSEAGVEVTLAEYDDEVTWAELVTVDHSLSLARLFHLHDRVHPLAYTDFFAYASSLRTATHSFIVGADVLDGHYSESRSVKRWLLAGIAARAGVDTRVINFSFNASPGPRAAAAAIAATADDGVDLYARDRIAHDRIGALTGRSSVIHADIAFNLKPQRSAVVDQAAAWVADQRGAGRTVIGVNVNPQNFEHIPGVSNPVDLVRELIATSIAETDEALNGGVAWLFIPHDWRPPVTEEELAHQTIGRLPGPVQARTHVASGPYSAMEAKALAAECDVVVTGRMHLAIASLGVGTPPLCIPYQGKFEGLMKHFGLPRLVLDVQTCIDTKTFSSELVATVRDRDIIQQTLSKEVEAIRASARIPLEI